MFLRFRHKWAHSIYEWEYQEVLEGTDLQEHAFMIEEEYNWSDKYRGVDIESVEVPPQEWLANKIKYYEDYIKGLRRTINRYKDLVKQES